MNTRFFVLFLFFLHKITIFLLLLTWLTSVLEYLKDSYVNNYSDFWEPYRNAYNKHVILIR